jgi:acetate kinase
MSKQQQPYTLGSGASVGGAVAKSFADVGTAISSGIEAVTGLKKHQANLEHLANETQKDYERRLKRKKQKTNLFVKRVKAVNNLAKPGTKVVHGDTSYTKASEPKKPPVRNSAAASKPAAPAKAAGNVIKNTAQAKAAAKPKPAPAKKPTAPKGAK